MSPVSWREEGRLVARERPPVLRKRRSVRWLTEARRKHANNMNARCSLLGNPLWFFWALYLKPVVRSDINLWMDSLTLLIKRVPLQEVFMACSKIRKREVSTLVRRTPLCVVCHLVTCLQHQASWKQSDIELGFTEGAFHSCTFTKIPTEGWHTTLSWAFVTNPTRLDLAYFVLLGSNWKTDLIVVILH